MKKLHYILFIFLLAISFNSCHKESVSQEPVFETTSLEETLVTKAKNWFESSESELQVLKYTKNIEWENAIVSDGVDGVAIEIPLVLNDNIQVRVLGESSFSIYDRLLLLFNNEMYRAYHVQIMTANPDFENNVESFNYYNLGQDFDGYVAVLAEEELTSNFNKYLNGEFQEPLTKEERLTATDPIYCIHFGVWSGNGFTPLFLVGCTSGSGNGVRNSGNGHYGGGRGTTGNSASSSPPSCKSFKFQSTGPNWQETAVAGIEFNVILANNKPPLFHYKYTVSLKSAIYFGAPKLDHLGNNFSAGAVAEASARALFNSMRVTANKFAQTNAHPSTVDKFFRDQLKRDYPKYIPGGRASQSSPNKVKVNPYKSNIVGFGSCD